MSQQPFFQKVTQARKSKSSVPNTSTSFFSTLNATLQNDTSDRDFLNYFSLSEEDHQRSDEALGLRTQHDPEASTPLTPEDDEDEPVGDEENSPISQPTPRTRPRHPNYGMKTVRQTSASSSNNPNEKRKRKQRWLQEIRKYQKSTRNLIPRASLIRLIKQVTAELSEKIPYIRQLAGEGAIRWRKDALAALHSAAEDYLHEFLTLSNYATLHAKRVTLMGRDLKLVQNINREHNRHSNNAGGKKQASFQERPARKRKDPKRKDLSESVPENSDDSMRDEESS